MSHAGWKVNMLGIDKEGTKFIFLENLLSKECPELFKINKTTIHIETGNILFNSVDSNESIYDFFIEQQGYTKKLLEIELMIFEDYKA